MTQFPTIDTFGNEHLDQDYLNKLEEAKKSVQEDESLHPMIIRCKEILGSLREKNDKSFYKNMHLGLSLAASLLFIVHIVFFGFWVGILGLLLVGFFFIYHKAILLRLSKNLNDNVFNKDLDGINTKEDVALFVNYIENGISIKLKRSQLIMLSLVCLTPLIFIAGIELIYGKINILEIFLAIVLGSTFWLIYFKKEIDDHNNLLGEVEDIKEELN